MLYSVIVGDHNNALEARATALAAAKDADALSKGITSFKSAKVLRALNAVEINLDSEASAETIRHAFKKSFAGHRLEICMPEAISPPRNYTVLVDGYKGDAADGYSMATIAKDKINGFLCNGSATVQAVRAFRDAGQLEVRLTTKQTPSAIEYVFGRTFPGHKIEVSSAPALCPAA